MKTIFDESSSVLKVLPKQTVQSFHGGRVARFVIREEIPEGVLCYHALLKIFLLLTKEEDAALTNADQTAPSFEFFVSRYFLVSENFDELKTIGEVRSVLQLLAPKKPLHRFTILPTTDCNARCFYCFEAGCKREDMSPETAKCTADFLLNVSGDSEIKIHWFGGEPLYRSEVIDLISERLTAAGKNFTSDLVTNGYLLRGAMIEKAVRDWHVASAQITLDGTEKVYNRRKAYIYKTGNPFETVLQNVTDAAKAGIRIDLRLNVDAKNKDDLVDLAGILKERLKGVPDVGVYARMLYGDYEDPAAYEAYYRVKEALEEAGIQRPSGIPRKLYLNRCMADTEEAVVILPDGSLCSCEHFSEIGPAWGSVGDRSAHRATVLQWSETYPKTEQCLECARMADCIRLRKCPVVHETCSLLEREQRTNEMREGMRSEYMRFKAQEAAGRETAQKA